jgi:hypothetical protein
MSEAERDTAPTPSAEITGRAEAKPVSGERDTDLSVPDAAGSNPDTLMSLPKPEPDGGHSLDERLASLETDLKALELRLGLLERGRDPLGKASLPWWFWLVFLAGLAITWRLLEALR